MRIRTRTEGQDTYIPTAEFSWQKKGYDGHGPPIPWERRTAARSAFDTNSGVYNNVWFFNPSLYPRFEEVIADDSDGPTSSTSQYHSSVAIHVHRPYKGRHPHTHLRKKVGKAHTKRVRDYSKGLRFNNCTHTIQTNHFYAPLMPIRTPGCGLSNAYIRNLSSGILTTALAVRVPPDVDMDDLADKALAYMYPRLDEGNSIVNFILELKDLEHMNPLPSTKRILQRQTSLRLLATKSQRKQFTKELINRLNGAHLNASFGIVPFVGDLVKFYDELVNLSKKLARLKEYESKVITRHYKQVVPESPGVLPTYDWTPFSGSTFLSWDASVVHDCTSSTGSRDSIRASYRARWITLPTYHATWQYIYTLDHMSALEEAINTTLDSLGARIDPGIVWDAIPFSFVVDWVVDCSSFLHSFARNNYPIRVQSGLFCHSLTYASETVVDVAFTDQSDGLNPSTFFGPNFIDPIFLKEASPYCYIPVYVGSRKYYNREKASPSLSTIEARAPTLRRSVLAGSLLLSRIRGLNSTKYHFRPH